MAQDGLLTNPPTGRRRRTDSFGEPFEQARMPTPMASGMISVTKLE